MHRTPKPPETARLWAVLQALDIEPQALAKALGMPYRTVTNFLWENTPPSGRLMRQLFKVYGVSIDWLLSGQGDMFAQPKKPHKIRNPA